MTETSDPTHVGRVDEYHLRRFVEARTRGDQLAMRLEWDALVTVSFDRVRAMVIVETVGRLSRDERDEALQLSLIKIANNMIETFHGTSMGEWVESARTLIHHKCLDVQRASIRRRTREPALEPGWGREDDGRWTREDREAVKRHDQEESDVLDDEAAADTRRRGQAFLEWALPRLKDDHRAVIELDRAGTPTDAMLDQLGIKRDALYKRRERAMTALANLHDRYDP